MIILFEGPDGGGKTTLIRTEFRDYREKHFGAFREPETAYRTYNRFLRDVACDVAIDRMHISELVYGPIMRDKPLLIEEHKKLERRLSALDVKLVMCLPPYDVALDNWYFRNQKGKEYVKNEDKYKRIYDAFVEIVITGKTVLPTIVYDYTKPEVNVLKCLKG